MSAPLEPGDCLVGFCAGYFGRDSYDDKYVVALGRDWLVVRHENGEPGFAQTDPANLVEYRRP